MTRIIVYTILWTLPTDDYKSHCSLTAKTTCVYNSKLHLANITSETFKGFNWLFFWPRGKEPKEVVKITYVTYIKTDNGDRVVVLNSTHQRTETMPDVPPFVFYPDVRAYKTDLIWTYHSGLVYHFTFDLKPHPGLNGAYYLHAELASKDLFDIYNPGNLPAVEKNTTEYLPNKMYVSGLNNPFLFPVNQIYTVGTGQIQGIAASTKALSQGQFGQFPLYVFSEDGIWSMEVGTSAYSVRTPVTRDVCNNIGSVTQLDNAIIFSSDRGLMLLEGAQVSCLSEVLDGAPFSPDDTPQLIRAFEQTGLGSLSGCIEAVRFSSYLRSARIGYDYVNSRLIISDPDRSYSWVYNIKNAAWGKLARSYQSVLNAYPECYGTKDNQVFRFSAVPNREDLSTTSLLLVTRPLKWGMADTLKRLSHIALRIESTGIQDDLYILVYGSRDGKNFDLVKAAKASRPIRICGSSFKSYIVALLGHTRFDTSINYLSADVETDKMNKLR